MSLQWHWWKQLAACTKMSLSSETGMWLNWISGSELEPEPSTVMIYPTTIIIWTWCSDVETMQCVFHCVHPCVCVCWCRAVCAKMSPQSSADEQFLQWSHQYYFLVIIFGSFPSDTKLSRMFLTMSSDDVCMIASELSSSLCFKICKGDVAGFSFSTSGHFVALFVAIKTNILRQNVMFSHREAAT